MMSRWIPAGACLLVLVACGDDANPDAGMDATDGALPDAPLPDAPLPDAPLPDSSLPDSSLDGGGEDAGADVGTREMCAEEGAMRVADCGMCGTWSEACVAEVWTPQSACLGQGECAVGAVETEMTSMCGSRQRICLDGCAWGEWSMVEPERTCVPGATRVDPDACGVGEPAEVTCTDACEWDEAVDCSTPCGPREDHGPLAQRACIPEGTTTLFYEDSAGAERTRTPTVSAFWIDRYPVTGARYQACVDAGACLSLSSDAPPTGAHAQLAPAWYADDYCEFVGGSVPTLAQLVRAARGDCGFGTRFAWSTCDATGVGDAPSCTTIAECSAACATPDNTYCTRVDATPVSASSFFVERLPGPDKSELVADLYTQELGVEYDGVDPFTPYLDELGPGTTFREGFDRRQLATTETIREFRCAWEVE